MSRTLTNVSNDLTRLASGGSAGERALRELAQLMRSGRSALVDVDLAALYAPERMLDEGEAWRRRLVSGLELFRDMLIFVPVIYTWWKIAQALQAFGSYTGSDPFLLAWQHGFGGRTDPLSTAAITVSGIVLGVIVLTFTAHLTRASHERHIQRRQRNLAVLLAEASVLLNQSLLGQATDVSRSDLTTIGTKIAASTSSLEETLTKTSEQITDAAKQIAEAVDAGPDSKLHDMFQRWTAAAAELRALGARLKTSQEVVDQLERVHNAVSALAQGIGEHTYSLLAALEAERTQSRQEAHAHHELAAEVKESTKALGDSLKGLTERAEQFNEMVLRLAYVVDRLDTDGAPSPIGGYGL